MKRNLTLKHLILKFFSFRIGSKQQLQTKKICKNKLKKNQEKTLQILISNVNLTNFFNVNWPFNKVHQINCQLIHIANHYLKLLYISKTICLFSHKAIPLSHYSIFLLPFSIMRKLHPFYLQHLCQFCHFYHSLSKIFKFSSLLPSLQSICKTGNYSSFSHVHLTIYVLCSLQIWLYR